jgi:hypothetical protein
MSIIYISEKKSLLWDNEKNIEHPDTAHKIV